MTLAAWVNMAREIKSSSGEENQMDEAKFSRLLDDARGRYDWVK